jgi:hypothetical protein
MDCHAGKPACLRRPHVAKEQTGTREAGGIVTEFRLNQNLHKRIHVSCQLAAVGSWGQPACAYHTLICYIQPAGTEPIAQPCYAIPYHWRKFYQWAMKT